MPEDYPVGLPRPVKGGQAATTAAYDDGLLAVLREAGGGPLTTRQVAVEAGDAYWPPDGKTARRLRALAAAGQVERWQPPGERAAYWRLPVPGQHRMPGA